MGAAIGSFCALFPWAPDKVTETRLDHPWLLFGLPVGGLAVDLACHWIGKSAESGNNLIVDQNHEPGAGMPIRIALLILVLTVITHLFGARLER